MARKRKGGPKNDRARAGADATQAVSPQVTGAVGTGGAADAAPAADRTAAGGGAAGAEVKAAGAGAAKAAGAAGSAGAKAAGAGGAKAAGSAAEADRDAAPRGNAGPTGTRQDDAPEDAGQSHGQPEVQAASPTAGAPQDAAGPAKADPHVGQDDARQDSAKRDGAGEGSAQKNNANHGDPKPDDATRADAERNEPNQADAGQGDVKTDNAARDGSKRSEPQRSGAASNVKGDDPRPADSARNDAAQGAAKQHDAKQGDAERDDVAGDDAKLDEAQQNGPTRDDAKRDDLKHDDATPDRTAQDAAKPDGPQHGDAGRRGAARAGSTPDGGATGSGDDGAAAPTVADAGEAATPAADAAGGLAPAAPALASATGPVADSGADAAAQRDNARPSDATASRATAATATTAPTSTAPATAEKATPAPAMAPPPPAGSPPARMADPDDDLPHPLANPRLPERLAENIERIESLGQRLLRALATKPLHTPAIEGPGPELYGSVAQAWMRLAAEQPARIIEQQVRYWGETLRHVAEAQGAFVQGMSAPPDDRTADKRFRNPLWQTNPFYSFVRRQYLINAEAIRKAAGDLQIADDVERRRVDWFTRQMIDMLSPTNFLATNPDALERALETEGESLVKGLENLVRDIEANGGELVVSLADRDAFRVGENIGTTPGDVVHRTPLFELIQFRPTTDKVHATPVVVFPPWINKYYIMDLKPQNSLLRWIVEQGYTLFVVSWRNPDASFADTAMDDYVASYLEVFDKVLELTAEPQLNAVGYCIAGTTLSATLGLLKQRNDTRVRSATLFTTLTDFSDQGEFTTFLQDDFVGGIEDEVARTGYLSAQLMQRTFSFLRANDLVWAPAIRSYMLGEAPPAFDLLYWNGDGTNLPGRMVTQYLRDLCQANALARDGFEVLGARVRLSDVTLPVCAVACENDHIAPWMHSWRGVAQMGSADRTFIMSESGHIAGIINPPGKPKYGHYTSDAGFAGSAEDWRAAATFHQGSWWQRWEEWLAAQAGGMVPARSPAQSLAPAPGTYVHSKA